MPGKVNIPDMLDVATREALIRAIDDADRSEIRILAERASEENMDVWEYVMSVVLVDVEEHGTISKCLLP